MTYRIECTCGEQTTVRGSQAGTLLVCSCGRSLLVPQFSILARAARAGQAARADQAVSDIPPHQLSEESLPREFFAFLTAESVLAQRINPEALMHYVKAFDRVVEEFGRSVTADQGLDLQVAVALLPEDRCLVEVQVVPDVVPIQQLDAFRASLEQIARPPVEDNPVAFVSRRMLGGGVQEGVPYFSAPFLDRLAGQTESLDSLLMQAAGLHVETPKEFQAPERVHSGLAGKVTGWFRQVVRSLRDRFPRPAKPATAEDALATSAEPERLPDHIRLQLPGCTIEQISRMIQHYPEHAELYGVRAALYRDEDRFDQVIQDCDRLIIRRPRDANALLIRAEAYCLTGSREQGLRDVTTVLRLAPQDSRALQLRGMIYMDLEAWKQAADDFSAAASLDHSNPTLQLHHARALLGNEDPERALQVLDVALQSDPHHAAALAMRALVRRHRLDASSDYEGVLERVLDDLDAAVCIEPDHIGHRLHRAATRLAVSDYAGVVEDSERVLGLDAGNGQAHALRGIARQGQGDSQGAIEDCTTAIESDAVTTEVYLARAAAFDDMEQLEPALQDCDAALALDPDCAVAYNARGLLHLKLQEMEQTLEDFGQAIDREPEWPLPYFNRGNAYRFQGENERAIDDYEIALQYEREAAPIYLSRGMAYLNMERLDDALQDFHEAVRLEPDLAPAYFSRSIVWLRRQQNERALEDLDETIRLAPDFAPAYFNRANLMSFLERYDEAIRDFDRLIDLCPDLGIAYSGRANVRILMGNFEKGDEDFRQAIVYDPGSSESYLVQQLLVEASYHHQREEYVEAISKTNEAIEMDAECLPARAIRAVAHWYSEQLVEALEDFDWLVEHEAEAFATHLGRGQVLAEQGEFKAALADLDRAINLRADSDPTPELGYAHSGRGLVRAGLECYDEADSDFETALALCPDNGWLHYNRGLRYDHQGDRQQAAECFEAALQATGPLLTPRKRKRASAYVRRARFES